MVITIGAYLNLPLPLKPLIVKSGSMEPTIKTGSLLLVMEQGKSTSRINYVNGDIITFKVKNEFISHRIVEIQKKDGFRYFVTKGDANQTPDTSLVAEKNVVGKTSLAVPYIGRFVTFVKNPLGFFLLILIPTLLIIISELFAVWEELRKKQSSSGGNLDFAKPMAMFFMAAIFVSSSHAFFSDVATSTNNTFTAAAIFPGAPGSVVINEINWVGSNGDGLDEWVELKNMTSSAIDLTNWIIDNLGTGSGPSANITITTCTPSCVIPANGFFLISAKTKTASKINIDPEVINSSISLSNGGEQLILKTDTSTIIDTANGSGAWFTGSNSSPKKTMERKSPPGDGTVSTNWQNAATHTNMDASGSTDEFGTPKAVNGL